MNKIMIASAALVSALAVNADVTSANVVGFLNKDSNKSGHTMIAGTFANVSTAAKYTLADLSVTGYGEQWFDPDGECWEGGCQKNKFQLKVLNNDGSSAAVYHWLDFKDGETEDEYDVYGPGWFTKEGSKYTALTKEECAAIEFNQGQGFWTLASGYQLVSAGQVTDKDLNVKCNASGHTPIANAMPMELTLGDLSVTGYGEQWFDPDGECWEGGCQKNKFQLKILNNDGSSAAVYHWLDFKDGETEDEYDVYGPGWYTKEGSKYTAVTKEQCAEIKFPAGQGFWTLGSGYQLVVPAPEL